MKMDENDESKKEIKQLAKSKVIFVGRDAKATKFFFFFLGGGG